MRPIDEIPEVGSLRETLRAMRSDRLGGLERFMRERGDIGRLAMAITDVVIVNTPELVHEVLVAKARSFEKSPIMRAALHPLVGQGLFTSEGDLWRRQRKLMAPLFQPASLAHFAGAMTAAAERAAASWTDGATLDVARETTRIAMSIAGQTLFGVDMWGESDELGEALTTALDWAGEQSASVALIVQSRLKVGLDLAADRAGPRAAERLRGLAHKLEAPVLWPGARTRDLRAALAVLEAKVAQMIAERRAHPEPRRDLLSLLLASRDEEGEVMDDRQVRDEILTLFVAGHETTANALAWSLMLLAQHPDVLAAARAEIDAVGRVPGAEDLPRLALCLRVFKEAMRLYPPVYMFARIAVAEVEVGGYCLPKGTVVMISPWMLHRRREAYPDPARFDPSRWTPGEESRRPRTAFLPFGAGPRTCIGNHFALMEGPLVLATLLRRAELDLVDPRGAVPETSATLRPKGGIPMRVRLRG